MENEKENLKEKELPELWLLWVKPPNKPGFYLGLGKMGLMSTNEKDAKALAKIIKKEYTVTPTRVK